MLMTVKQVPFRSSSDNNPPVWRGNQLGVQAQRHREAAPARTPESGLSNWQLAKVYRYIDCNLEKRIRVSDLGELVQLSGSRFSRCFRVSVGVSPYNYILSRRVDAAKRMLATTEEPLCHIALACGLCDQSHLSNVFKRLSGVTPLAWRKSQAGCFEALAVTCLPHPRNPWH